MLDLPATDPQAAPGSGARRDERAGMDEPGIFKGCRGVGGPLPEATKRAILVYLCKPTAGSWERLKPCAIVGRTTLAEAWTLTNPAGEHRFPAPQELIRALRVAVIAQWAGSTGRPQNTH
ncbi:MAG TPA: hypothetical protein DCM32_09830 [Xanthomonadaceae bacterium]|nr:hypothetical protein [Xanthomonadaceae bacterium]